LMLDLQMQCWLLLLWRAEIAQDSSVLCRRFFLSRNSIFFYRRVGSFLSPRRIFCYRRLGSFSIVDLNVPLSSAPIFFYRHVESFSIVGFDWALSLSSVFSIVE
jgi:hypothetical protein